MGTLRASSYWWKQRSTKKCEELLNKIRGLIRSIINNSDNYKKKYMKIKFNSDVIYL